MADDTTSSQAREDRGGRPSGGRPPGNREPGGFRIRLSDNELRAARAIQDGFGLRSTVAALGFAIRTVAQLLEDGQLDALVAQQQAQGGNRGGDNPRGDNPRGDRRPSQGEGRGSRPDRAPRIDPFARPSKPAAPAPEIVPVEISAEIPEEAQEVAAAELPENLEVAAAPGAEAPLDESTAPASPETTES